MKALKIIVYKNRVYVNRKYVGKLNNPKIAIQLLKFGINGEVPILNDIDASCDVPEEVDAILHKDEFTIEDERILVDFL